MIENIKIENLNVINNLNKMEIQLNGKRGGTTLVSPEDFEKTSAYKWTKDANGVIKGTKSGTTFRLSRLIMDNPKGKIVDHINGDKSDNRRENLRITDSKGNSQNKLKQPGKTSKYIGVSLKNKKYSAYITVNDKVIQIRSFVNEIDAGEARDM